MKIRPPVDVHEGMVDHFAARDPRTGQVVIDPTLTALSGAVKATRQNAEALAELAEALPRDPGLSPEAAMLKLKGQALKLAEAAARRLDAARTAAAEEIERIASAIRLPPRPTDPHLASEIRARLAALPEDKRRDTLAAAAKDGDEAILGAILNAPAMLTGMGPAEWELRRIEWQRKRHPAETARLERLQKAVEAHDRAGRVFVSYVNDLISSPSMGLAEAAAKRAEQAQAAVAAQVEGA